MQAQEQQPEALKRKELLLQGPSAIESVTAVHDAGRLSVTHLVAYSA